MFFTNDTADIVQLISLPLELLGFTLALIEVRYPFEARSIEAWIDKIDSKELWNSFLKLGSLTVGLTLIATTYAIYSAIEGIIPVVFYSVDVMRGPKDAEEKIEIVVNQNALGGALAFSILALIIAYIEDLIVKGIQRTIHLLKEISDGRAIGSLGLIFALLGCIGEVYQVLTLYFGG